jgi:putative NADH-flavin reductase
MHGSTSRGEQPVKKIALFGATGMIGQRILNEALSRGHHVTAIVRDPSKLAATTSPLLRVEIGDVLKPESVAVAIADCDVVVSAYGPGRAGDPRSLLKAAESLIEGVGAVSKKTGNAIRLIVVGGAGSLEVAPGVQLVDTPDFPASWKPAASAARDALGIYRKAPIKWTYMSPAAFIQPGTRTGKYRTATEQLITDEKGESRISAEDYAVALLDEIDAPRFECARFTAAY